LTVYYKGIYAGKMCRLVLNSELLTVQIGGFVNDYSDSDFIANHDQSFQSVVGKERSKVYTSVTLFIPALGYVAGGLGWGVFRKVIRKK